MITGLLLLGFVGYQLWGTGIEMARAQSDLRQRLESRVAVPVDEVDDIAADEPSTTSSDAASDRPITEADSDSAERPVQPAPGSADDPVTESIDESSFAPISTGDPIARIEMPSLGTDHIVVAGIGVDELRLGPGHFPDTPLPGQLGNVAIAGHRTTYGQPFHDVDLLAPGDEIVLTTVTGRFVYLVDDISIVDPTEYAVVSTTDRTRARLTLTSCHPKWSAAKRIVVRAELDTQRSDAVSPATDYLGSPVWDTGGPIGEGAASAALTGVASTTTTPVESSTATTDTSTTEPADISTSTPADTSTTAPARSTAGSEDGASPGSDDLAGEFGRGWFHDSSAIWQVLVWASGLLAIVVASQVLSRRRRSHLVGYGLGLLPGLVVLYFVYVNVNRLLPPNL